MLRQRVYEYIKRKEDAFEEGKEIIPDQLMKHADEKYKTLLQKGTWNVPDANEEKILALQVEINKLKSKSGKAKKTERTNPVKTSQRIQVTRNQHGSSRDQSIRNQVVLLSQGYWR